MTYALGPPGPPGIRERVGPSRARQQGAGRLWTTCCPSTGNVGDPTTGAAGRHGGCMAPYDDHIAPGEDALVRPGRVADLRAAGVTGHELARSPLWVRPYRGVRAWAAAPTDHVLTVIHSAAALLPVDGAVGGWAAATLLGAAHGVTPDPPVVDLVVPPHRRLRPRRGIAVHRERLDATDVTAADGRAVTTAARTCFDALRRDPLHVGLPVVDAVLRARLVDADELTRYVAAHGRWRGVPAARARLALADGRTESLWETRLRLLWVEAGLSRPQVNVAVRDLHGGLLGRPDLLDLEAGLAAEFDGAQHRSPAQHRADNDREERFERAGLVVVRFDAVDVAVRTARSSARLRAGHADGLARDRCRDRWQVRPEELQ